MEYQEGQRNLLVLKVVGLFFFFGNVVSSDQRKPLERFSLNLDLPEEQRWVEIAKRFSNYSNAIKKEMVNNIPPTIFPLVEKIAGQIESYVEAPYAKEMIGVAKGFNMSVADIFIVNIWYSITAYCTSIVVENQNGTIIHGRNLDYSFTGLLRNLAITVDFQRKGKTAYTGTLFVPQVGLVTGQRPGVFTISLDERDKGSLWMNIIEAILDRTATLSFFTIRSQLDSAVSFDEVVHGLTRAHFIAPEYFIIGGVTHGQGAVITHGRYETKDVWFMNETQTKWFIVETNYDHWTTPPPSDDRRDPAIKALKSVGQERMSPDSLFQVLSVKPVLNEGTTYTTIMAAKMPRLYQSYRRNVTQT